MELLLAVHAVTGAAEEIGGTVVKSYSEDTEQERQLPSTIVVYSSFDRRTEIGREFANLATMTRGDDEEIVQSGRSK